MQKQLFDNLVKSMTQMDEIVRGERAPLREFHIDGLRVKAIRQKTGLSQSNFAKLIDVPVGTVRNWEQGRREVMGPARALLKALSTDPAHVVKAIRAAA
jgi:putative transcriptional regulator